MALPNYIILESELGPLISHSRTSVYDVLEALNQGQDFYQICVNYNLNPVQTEVALEYIAQHRERLQQELNEILPKKAEYEQYHRAIQAEIQQKIAQLPMTPQRKLFYERLEKGRQRLKKKRRQVYAR